MAQLDRDGDYVVSEGWVVIGRVTKLLRDGWLSRKGVVAMFVSDGRLS